MLIAVRGEDFFGVDEAGVWARAADDVVDDAVGAESQGVFVNGALEMNFGFGDAIGFQ